MRPPGAYSTVVEEQLDRLAEGSDLELYRGVLDACELALTTTQIAQASSSVVATEEGIRFRLPVAGRPEHHVFWSATDDGARIEAVFPHP